jgi:hypothetical protein
MTIRTAMILAGAVIAIGAASPSLTPALAQGGSQHDDNGGGHPAGLRAPGPRNDAGPSQTRRSHARRHVRHQSGTTGQRSRPAEPSSPSQSVPSQDSGTPGGNAQ